MGRRNNQEQLAISKMKKDARSFFTYAKKFSKTNSEFQLSLIITIMLVRHPLEVLHRIFREMKLCQVTVCHSSKHVVGNVEVSLTFPSSEKSVLLHEDRMQLHSKKRPLTHLTLSKNCLKQLNFKMLNFFP